MRKESLVCGERGKEGGGKSYFFRISRSLQLNKYSEIHTNTGADGYKKLLRKTIITVEGERA